jgi:hypothetical protein
LNAIATKISSFFGQSSHRTYVFVLRSVSGFSCYVICSVVANLMENYNFDFKNIGRLEVATETIQDHSKSVKTYLMKLFEESGNFNVEGECHLTQGFLLRFSYFYR